MSSHLTLVSPTRGVPVSQTPDREAGFGDTFGWTDILLLVRRRLRMIVLIAFVVSVAALPSILAVPKLYYSETRVLLTPSPAATADPRTPVAALTMETEIERLLSHEVVRSVIDRFDLASRAEFNPQLQAPSPVDQASALGRSAVLNLLGLAPAETGETPRTEKVTQTFRESLAVSRQGTTNVLAVGFVSEDPGLSETIPTAMIDAYLSASGRSQREATRQSVAWLDNRIAVEREQTEAARLRLDGFLRETGIASMERPEVIGSRLRLLETRQEQVARERREVAAARRSVKLALASPDRPALAEPDQLVDLRRDLQREMQELAKTASVYGEEYGGVSARKNRIDALKAEITSELNTYSSTLDLRAGALADEADGLESDIDRLSADLGRLEDAQPETDRLTEDLITRQEMLTDLEGRRATLLSMIDVPPVALEVLKPASYPSDPLGPGRKVYLLAAMLAGTVLGLLAAALAELCDRTVRSPEQLPEMPRSQPLGLVPRPSRRARRTIPRLLSQGSGADVPTAEGIRDALFLLGCADGGRLPPLVIVAPARRRDAVVPVAEWLAAAVAGSAMPVWLVSTGARYDRPRTDDGAVVRLTLSAEAERHGSTAKAIEELAAMARQLGGTVFVDAPPLHTSQSLGLARAAGNVLLVLRWGRTPRKVAGLVLRLLSRVGAVQVATLIVDADPARHRLYGFADRLSLVARDSAGRG
ncbi:GumC family protein [Roseivivax isoporae]|uniref:Polysaccharide chain length determinant N-terminal domain-containing protein n=1 Tax=Roseivivax isoporae LMG 25204 TaxID=1449351 RepID=X7F9E8_9RHOB|nr:hypothetical protein [Roseivivax isoporae]ETX28736.1 hypothetical protein RISW2_05400 [Roseivivax isoporae LMG 25204]